MTTLAASPSAPSEELASRLIDAATPASLRGGAESPKAERVANTLVLALLFAAPALMCVHAASVIDPDIWWHLSTGQWILNHRAVPQTDPFSIFAGKPWQAYSWLFAVLVIKLFHRLGMVGIVAFTSGMVFVVTVALYGMVRSLQRDFSLAVLLAFLTAFSMGPIFTPRPWMFTILFFVLELGILMHARRTGRLRGLAWLPLIFAFWANIHIQFVDGLLVLGLAFAESILARWWTAAETRIRPAAIGAALLFSALATLANPYGWRVYSVVFDYSSRLATSGSALNRITEMQAMPFRDASDFLILLLALASAAALAWQRRFVLFESALLLFASVVSFRSQRDIWVMATVSALILASRLAVSRKPAPRTSTFATGIAALAAALVVFAGFGVFHVNNASLQTQLSRTLPADAVHSIRAHGYRGPLFDYFDWGGYLIWSLQMPVNMDGRASFYGDRRINRSVATWNGEPDWASDPQLTSAGVVLAPVRTPLTQLLRTDSQFQLVYEDRLAAVFIPRK